MYAGRLGVRRPQAVIAPQRRVSCGGVMTCCHQGGGIDRLGVAVDCVSGPRLARRFAIRMVDSQADSPDPGHVANHLRPVTSYRSLRQRTQP